MTRRGLLSQPDFAIDWRFGSKYPNLVLEKSWFPTIDPSMLGKTVELHVLVLFAIIGKGFSLSSSFA
jgi:hypothetical protein